MSKVYLMRIMPFLKHSDKALHQRRQESVVCLYVVKLKERSKAAFFVFTCVYGFFTFALNLSTYQLNNLST